MGAGHGNRQGLSYGQLAQGLSARLIRMRDHRLAPVERWSQTHQAALSRLLGVSVGVKDFTDDRLADLMYALGNAGIETREALETTLGHHLERAYHLPTEEGRADTTSVSVYHDRAAGTDGLLQFGKSKDHRPDLRQYVQALETLDPAGLPLVIATVGDGRCFMHYPAWSPRSPLFVTGCLFTEDPKDNTPATIWDADANGIVKVWDSATGEEVMKFKVPGGAILNVDWLTASR